MSLEAENRSVECKDLRKRFRLRAVVVEPNLRNLPIAGLIDGDVVPLGPSPVALGPPSDERGRVVDRVQERLGLDRLGTLPQHREA
jgi:hypothetical protein